MGQKVTRIPVRVEIRDRLKKLGHKEETYDDVIEMFIENATDP